MITFKSQTHGNHHGFQTVNRAFTAFFKASAGTHLKLLATKWLWSCPKLKFKNLKNVCDGGNEQRSLEGGGLSIYSSTPNLIAFHPKTTTDCSSNHRRVLRAASTQEAHSTRTNVENTVLDAAGLFLAGSVCGVNRRSLYILAESHLNFSWTGSSRLLTWLQPRPKTFSTEDKSVPWNLSVFESKPFCFDISVFNSNNHSLWNFVITHFRCI